MSRFFAVKNVLTFVLALILAGAPVVQALASISMTAGVGGAHAGHLAGAGMVAVADDAAADPQASCVQHEDCGSPCCVACGHCLTAAVLATPSFSYSLPVQTPVVPRFHSLLAAAYHDRPPQVSP